MLNVHDSSLVHKEAMMAWINYKQSKMQELESVHVSSSGDKIIALNRHYIKAIADIILFCATHDLPLRGHSESQGTEYKGVFLDLIAFTAKHDPEF